MTDGSRLLAPGRAGLSRPADYLDPVPEQIATVHLRLASDVLPLISSHVYAYAYRFFRTYILGLIDL